MLSEKNRTRRIAYMGLLIALKIILTYIVAINTPYYRFGFAFIPSVLMGAIFGPSWTMLGMGIADVLGSALFGSGSFFIGFTVSACVLGFLYGVFYYKKTFTLLRVVVAAVTLSVLSSLFFTPLWLQLMYGVPFFTSVSGHFIKLLIDLPITIALTYAIGNVPVIRQLIYRVQKG